MTEFTVVGYWPDTMQRFCTSVDATTPDEAEETCLREHPCLAVCGVFLGPQECVDSSEFVGFGAD